MELGGSLQAQSYPYIPETDLVTEKTPPSSHMPEFPGSQGRKGLHPKGEVLLEHLRNCPRAGKSLCGLTPYSSAPFTAVPEKRNIHLQ